MSPLTKTATITSDSNMLEQLSIKLKYLSAWTTKTHWNKFAIFIIIIMIFIITVSQPLLCSVCVIDVWRAAGLCFCLTCASSDFTQNQVMLSLPAGLYRHVFICALEHNCRATTMLSLTSSLNSLLSQGGEANPQPNPTHLVKVKNKFFMRLFLGHATPFHKVSWKLGEQFFFLNTNQ